MNGSLAFIFLVLCFVVLLPLYFDYYFNYRTRAGSTVFETGMDYTSKHKKWYLLALIFFLLFVLFLFV